MRHLDALGDHRLEKVGDAIGTEAQKVVEIYATRCTAVTKITHLIASKLFSLSITFHNRIRSMPSNVRFAEAAENGK